MSNNKENEGAIFKQEKTNSSMPDYSGKANVSGANWHVAAWINETEKGLKYVKLRFSVPKEAEAPVEKKTLSL